MPVDAELLAHARARVGKVLCRKYTVEEVLGVGGMAAVYAAKHRNGRRVAVKLLHPELSIRLELRKRFLREGHAATAVNHPGAVVVLDDDVAEDGAAFLVMELLDGQNVEELWEMNGRRLPEKAVMAIARDLAEVLVAAHSAGVVHRDIKPANLFLTRQGRLKVLDFGIARVRDAAASSATQTGAVFGTPAFMAPEQASGRVSLVDAQTDVRATGATMFTLLTGRTVHEGETGQHLAMLSATQRARSLGSVMPDAAHEIVALVDRALAFEKSARWRSADALRVAIVEASRALYGELPSTASASDTMKAAERVSSPTTSSPELALLGTTTGTPVPSDPTRVYRRPTPFLTRAMSSVGALLGFAMAPTVPASTTPTTSWTDTSTSGVLRVLVGVSLAVGLAVLLGALALRARLRESTTTGSPGALVEASPSVSAPNQLTESNLPAPPQPTTVTSPTAATAAPKAAGRGLARPVATATASVTPTTPIPPAKGKCDSPYFIDATGKKLWKAECL